MAKKAKVLDAKVVVTISNATKNTDGSNTIEDIKQEIAGVSFKNALGSALTFCQETINKQFDNPTITIAGITLTDAQVKKVRFDRLRWESEGFYLLFTELRSIIALDGTEAERVSYIRDTDRNGVFTGVDKFTTQQVAAQSVAVLRAMKDTIKFIKEDASDSVVSPELAARRLAAKERDAAKRLAMKQAQLA